MAFLEEYTLLDELGQGGYATVYKVRHNKLGYIRAIRVLNAIIAHGEEDKTYQKFLEECRLLLRLGNGNHPNIVHIYQPLLKEQRAIVEMDFVDGKDLYHYLETNHSFVEIKDVMRLLTDIGSALAYCHEDIYKFCMDKDEDNLQDDPEDGSKVLLDEETKERLIEKYRVIHNDIHSCNIIRREDGTYVLLDFGLAIESGSVVRSSRRKNGAPEFKAPEKWDNDSILTTQSDIYSFGVVLYEYLAGRVPFVFDKSKSNPAEAEYLLGEAHKKQEPTPIFELRKTAFENAHPGETYKKDYPDWLEALIMKCLSKSTNERFKNGKELYDYVLAHIGNEYDAQIETLTQEIKAKEVVINELANSLAKAQIETQEIKAELEKIKKENRVLSDKLQEANQAPDNIGDPIPAPNPVEGTPQEWVDLGLPSGTKWATCNVGASSQEDFGNYYAWGETTPKSEYTESNSVTIKNNPDDLCNSGIIDTEGNLTMQNDAARQNWGGDWRMPTYEEFEELKITCTWRWTTKNGIDGYEVIGSNGNSIFLPFAGMCVEASCYDVGVNGTYWTSNVVTDNDYAFGLGFDSDGCTMYTVLREYGLPVRPVIGSSTPSEPNNDGRDEKGGVKWQVVLIIITILILLCLGLFVKNSNSRDSVIYQDSLYYNSEKALKDANSDTPLIDMIKEEIGNDGSQEVKVTDSDKNGKAESPEEKAKKQEKALKTQYDADKKAIEKAETLTFSKIDKIFKNRTNYTEFEGYQDFDAKVTFVHDVVESYIKKLSDKTVATDYRTKIKSLADKAQQLGLNGLAEKLNSRIKTPSQINESIKNNKSF